MNARVEEITAAALSLPEEERMQLADRLMESLDGPPDADYEQAWTDEIARRLAEVRAGTAETVPWAEVRKQLLEDSDGDDR